MGVNWHYFDKLQAVDEVVKFKPKILEQLKDIVSNFASSIDGEQLMRMVLHTRPRTELCCEKECGHFEYLP